MRFLADESFDFGVVRALRSAGHDVSAVAEISPRAEDPDVVDLAVSDDRLLLLTEDGESEVIALSTELTSSPCSTPRRCVASPTIRG